MGSIEDLINNAKPRTLEAKVCSRGDLIAQHEQLQQELTAAQAVQGEGLVDETRRAAEELARRIVALEQEIDDAAVTIRVQSIGRKAWADLLARYAPTKEQARAGMDHDPERFPTAALAASAVEPEISRTQALALMEALPVGEWLKVWNAVLAANLGTLDSPKSRAAARLLQPNGRSAATSDPEGSLVQRSSDVSAEQ